MSLLKNARNIKLVFEFDSGVGLVINNRYCSVNTLETCVPSYRTSLEMTEWVKRHYCGNQVGSIVIGRYITSNHFNKVNMNLDYDIQELILGAPEYNVPYVKNYSTDVGNFSVSVTILTEKNLELRDISDEMSASYTDYAMSVIIGRALPDVRDGLKPVHRRSLFAMSQLNNSFKTPYKKSARIVGDVIGKYHPHGDSAVYDTLVRLAQPFSMRYPLVDGQGNFGSIDGDSAAAMRYTEIRMQEITAHMISDLPYDTVDYVPNYDGTEYIPEVFPTRIPNLLVNGSSGIAVGMATNIPPHNLREVISGCLAMIDNRDITIDELMTYITGPDFPTGSTINGVQGIRDAYHTGRGKVYMRGVAHIEEHKGNRESIVITEIPYQVNKSRLIEKIADLVKDHKLEGISNLRDESDKDGIRIVVEVKRDAVADVVLNNIYSTTQLQCTFGINMVALQNGQPKLFNLKEMINAFINHRCEVVTRRTSFKLKKALARLWILNGYILALDNLTKIIKIIRQNRNKQEAINALLAIELQTSTSKTDVSYTQLTRDQVDAIIELKLYQLTGMERTKISNEIATLADEVEEYRYILGDHNKLMDVIAGELNEMAETFGDDRLTDISHNFQELSSVDLIENERVVLTLSSETYVKYQPVSEYNSQRRGGVGKSSAKLKDTDYMTTMEVCNTHDTVLCFSSSGKVYSKFVYELPAASRGARGKPIINILPLEKDEAITAILPISVLDEDHYVFMATAFGTVKKVALSNFTNVRASGIIAIKLNEGDELIGVGVTDGSNEAMLFSDNGKVVRFKEDTVRAMGRAASGVRGMSLKEDGRVVSLVIPKEGSSILTATELGYGKQTPLDKYPIKGRATQGVVSIKVNRRNGNVIGAVQAMPADTLMLVTNEGMLIRTDVNKIAVISRNTQGVILMNLKEKPDVKLIGIARVAECTEVK